MRLDRRMVAAAIVVVVAAAGVAAQEFSFERVRADFFAGTAGDAEAMRRGMATARAALDADSSNPHAMVVHGFGSVVSAVAELQKGNMAAMPAMQRGFAEMDEAVRLAPKDGLVRVLRGIMMQQATRQMPEPARMQMLENGRADFQFLFDAQQAELAQLGTHRLGELLQALGDINSRLSRTDEAERYYRMVTTMLPQTDYARRAEEWLQTKAPLPAAKTQCIGCHVASH